MEIQTSNFGRNGAKLFSIKNDNGLVLEVSDYGARIVNLYIPEKNGQRNLVLGFDSADEYQAIDTYIGATIGRVAGRITGAEFALNQQRVHLPKNDGENTLHGGNNSFDQQIWQGKIEEQETEISVVFSLTSPNMENGFPGALQMSVRYTLTNQNEWKIGYQAETDQPTLFNPTNHVYFNLNKQLNETIGQHSLYINSEEFAVLAMDVMPTGEKRSVQGTPFDFRRKEGQPVQQGFTSEYQQNKLVGGYDHPFILAASVSGEPQAILTNNEKNIAIKMFTDAPSVVVYTSNGIAEPVEMQGESYIHHGGITLETQILPDAINQSDFGDSTLTPGETFNSETIFQVEWTI